MKTRRLAMLVGLCFNFCCCFALVIFVLRVVKIQGQVIQSAHVIPQWSLNPSPKNVTSRIARRFCLVCFVFLSFLPWDLLVLNQPFQ